MINSAFYSYPAIKTDQSLFSKQYYSLTMWKGFSGLH